MGFCKVSVRPEYLNDLPILTESSSPPRTTIRCSTFFLAVYRRSRYETTSSVFSPSIQSSFSWFAEYTGQSNQHDRRGRKCTTPKSILVRLISPTISFLSLRASRRDAQRPILLRKDSNCLASVRIVIASVAGVLVPGTRGLGVAGIWASKTLRTFETNRLSRYSQAPRQPWVGNSLLLMDSCACLVKV